MVTKILKTKCMGDVIQISYFNLPDNKIYHESSEHSNKQLSQLSARSRAVSNIKEIVQCNDFDYFVTITIKYDFRTDLEKSKEFIQKKIKYYQKLAKRKGYDFKFVYVFELTENKGLHLHGFFKGMYDLYTNEYGHLSSFFFDSIGFQCYQDRQCVNINYLIKYIIKSPISFKSNYYCSRGLEKAENSYYKDYLYEFKDLGFTFQNQYCKMITYKVSDNL